jgi:hypothetical protein
MCPCIECITLARCKHKKLWVLIKKCVLLRDFLVKRENSKGEVLDAKKLLEFCNYMGIEMIYPSSKVLNLKYPWEKVQL